MSLRSITTEVLKVLNATEELLQGVEGGPALSAASLPPNTDPKKLDQQFSRLEENVSSALAGFRPMTAVCVNAGFTGVLHRSSIIFLSFP